MADRTISLNSPILFDAGEVLPDAELVVDKVVIVDGQQYIVGSFDAGRMDSISGTFISSDDIKQFMIAVDEPLELDGLMNKQLNTLLQGEIPSIMEAKGRAGIASFLISEGEEFDDIFTAARTIGTPDVVAVPSAAMPDSPEPDAPARVLEGFDLSSPALVEGIDMDGTKVDIAIHEIEYVDDKPFMSGTFTVETASGFETREFALPVDSEALKDLEGLSNADLEARLNDGGFDRFLNDPNHQMVLSTGESFTDRSKLLADIAKLEDFTGSGPHVGLLAIMGQNDPNFVGNLDRYMGQGFDPDQAIKLSVLDAVGISDIDRRERFIYGTGDLDEFAQRLRPYVDLEHNGVMDVLNAMGEQVRQSRILAGGADAAMDAAESARALSRAAQASKWGAKVAGVGIAIGAASTAMAAVAKDAQIDLAEQIAGQDPPLLSEEALQAYKEMAQDVFENTLIDNGIGTVDQIGVSAIVTIGFEARASAKYQEWLDTYAPNLPPEYVDALSPTSFETKNAQMAMLDDAVENLPSSKEGVPEGLHALIDASNAYRAAQQELVDMTLGKPHMSAEEMQDFMMQASMRDKAREDLMDAMYDCMGDPENIRGFLDMLPEEDRLEFARRLAESDENKELMAALHPKVAEYIEAYNNSGLGYYIVGLDEEDYLNEHMDLVTDYIMDRAGLVERPQPDLDNIRATIDQMLAGGGIPDDAPPEFMALAELQGNPDMQAQIFADQLADGMAVVSQVFAEDHYTGDGLVPETDMALAATAERAPAQIIMSPS